MYNYFPIPLCNKAAAHYLKTNTYGISSIVDLGALCLIYPDYELEMIVSYLDIISGLGSKYPIPPILAV
jgi:hypothetical protein